MKQVDSHVVAAANNESTVWPTSLIGSCPSDRVRHASSFSQQAESITSLMLQRPRIHDSSIPSIAVPGAFSASSQYGNRPHAREHNAVETLVLSHFLFLRQRLLYITTRVDEKVARSAWRSECNALRKLAVSMDVEILIGLWRVTVKALSARMRHKTGDARICNSLRYVIRTYITISPLTRAPSASCH